MELVVHASSLVFRLLGGNDGLSTNFGWVKEYGILWFRNGGMYILKPLDLWSFDTTLTLFWLYSDLDFYCYIFEYRMGNYYCGTSSVAISMTAWYPF